VSSVNSPIVFKPIFQERIWGGRKLAELFAKQLPAGKRIGEAWEIVDRPEAQSVVARGVLKGKTLHQLWTACRADVFGKVPDSPRFPLLIKLLDAQEKLSLQVHPPSHIAARLGGEAKTECWYVAAAEPGAQLFVGFRERTTPEQFKKSVQAGSVADHLHTIEVKAGDTMFLAAGRFHAVGAGNLLIEIQQNSDTTYRVFDWNRLGPGGKPRQLHVEQALECIDFDDVRPTLIRPEGESLVKSPLFEIEKWDLKKPREIAPEGQFAIVCCLTGKVGCAQIDFSPGQFCLVPALAKDRQVQPKVEETTLLRITIP
jgi:mannose-6-phosphate isomerase